MTERITAVVICYEDGGALLRGCLASLRPQVDRLVVVDGAYADFPHTCARSSAETLDVAREFADALTVVNTPWPSEVVKRDYGIRFCRPGDWVLEVDADEVLHGTIDKGALVGESLFDITLKRTDGVPPYEVFRLFRKGHATRHLGVHHAIWEGDVLLNKLSRPTLGGVHLEHHVGARSKERSMAKGAYYRKLADSESTMRANIGL